MTLHLRHRKPLPYFVPSAQVSYKTPLNANPEEFIYLSYRRGDEECLKDILNMEHVWDKEYGYDGIGYYFIHNAFKKTFAKKNMPKDRSTQLSMIFAMLHSIGFNRFRINMEKFIRLPELWTKMCDFQEGFEITIKVEKAMKHSEPLQKLKLEDCAFTTIQKCEGIECDHKCSKYKAYPEFRILEYVSDEFIHEIALCSSLCIRSNGKYYYIIHLSHKNGSVVNAKLITNKDQHILKFSNDWELLHWSWRPDDKIKRELTAY